MKEYFNKIFYRTKPEDSLDRVEVLIFLIGTMQVGHAFIFADGTGLINKVGFIVSIISACVFIVFTLIVRRKPYQIIFISLILYSLLIIFHWIAYHGLQFNLSAGNVLMYFFLVKALKEINAANNNKIIQD